MGFIFFIILIIILLSCIRIVPQAKCYVIEFLGSYKQTWGNGLHFKIPIFERVSNIVSMKELVADFPPQPVITKDNVTMQIDTVVYYKIFDAKLFTYGVENPIMALENLTATTLRNIIGDLELDETLTSRDLINNKMREIIDLATDPWGIKVNRIELKNIIPPKEIQQAMEKQMKAEREKRQTLLEAEAHKESVVSRAEGDKQAKILAAEAERDSQIALAKGRAESIRVVYEAEAEGIEMLKKAKADESVLTLKKLDALKTVSDGRATKIFIPTELANAATSLGVTAEMLGIGHATPINTDPKEKKNDYKDECCDDKDEHTKKIKETNENIESDIINRK